jgi:transcriptional regulator with XRE-family HTH domain
MKEETKHPHQNRLDYYRRRMRFSTLHVGHLLGHKDSSTYRDYERGDQTPTLVNAFRLSAIFRTPVEFLFPNLYDALRDAIRAEEERLAQPKQAVLF